MSFHKLFCCSVFLLILGAGRAQAHEQITSVYTPLYGEKCTLEFVEKITGASVSRCPGAGGFELLVATDDERMSISVIDLSKKEYPLNYWEVVTTAMSTLGDVAEWRVVKRQGRFIPIALIVRVKSLDQSDPDHPKEVPFIAIAKIKDQEICVVAAIRASKIAAERARREADKARNKVCLPAP
jgi:hypothetical protein